MKYLINKTITKNKKKYLHDLVWYEEKIENNNYNENIYIYIGFKDNIVYYGKKIF